MAMAQRNQAKVRKEREEIPNVGWPIYGAQKSDDGGQDHQKSQPRNVLHPFSVSALGQNSSHQGPNW
jgi:hypothetical protein